MTRPTLGAFRYRIVQGGKAGFIDRLGRVAIQPRFDKQYTFDFAWAERLAAACESYARGFGYLDTDGHWRIGPEFIQADGFSEGLAFVKRRGDRVGVYIDVNGHVRVCPRDVDVVWSFHEGRALAKRGKRYGYIDRRGRWAIPPRFDVAGQFSGGAAVVGFGGKDGLINAAGRWLIKPRFERHSVFGFDQEGLAMVRVGKRHFYVDRRGDVVIRERGFRIGWSVFRERRACVKVGKRFGFIDPTGTLVIPPRFAGASAFSEGLAPVRISSRSGYGYIDRAGEMVIAPRYANAHPFHNGLACVELGGRREVLDALIAERITNQRLAVLVDTKVGYIDMRGKYVWAPTD